QLAEAAGPALLGPEVAARYENRLPYLLKLLDARKMLSIQAHPTIPQAIEGYEREEKAGLPLQAPTRNYKDRNHKPEIHVGVSDFWMLHGFRPLEEIAATLEGVPEFLGLMPSFWTRLSGPGKNDASRAALLRELYETVMTLPQER